MSQLFFALYLLFFLIFPVSSFAQVEFDIDRNYSTQIIKGTGFPDYPPFGYPTNSKDEDFFGSIFNFLLQDVAKKSNFMVTYDVHGSYDQLVRDARGGKFDFIIGAYSATEKYAGLELIYPALINNPVVIITPSNSSAKISKLDDLKKLKGGVGSYEHFSDFVNQQISSLNISSFDKPYNLYKDLFTKKIDFVLASEYNARILLSKLGLRTQIAMSNPIWSIPVFIGISKASSYRGQLRRGLTNLSSKPEAREKVVQNLQAYINRIEEENISVNPIDFFSDE